MQEIRKRELALCKNTIHVYVLYPFIFLDGILDALRSTEFGVTETREEPVIPDMFSCVAR